MNADRALFHVCAWTAVATGLAVLFADRTGLTHPGETTAFTTGLLAAALYFDRSAEKREAVLEAVAEEKP